MIASPIARAVSAGVTVFFFFCVAGTPIFCHTVAVFYVYRPFFPSFFHFFNASILFSAFLWVGLLFDNGIADPGLRSKLLPPRPPARPPSALRSLALLLLLLL